VRLRGVTAHHRARRAASGGRPRQHHAAPALPGHGSVGVAKWRGGHRRALREWQGRERISDISQFQRYFLLSSCHVLRPD
jgi:hypothetical protein